MSIFYFYLARFEEGKMAAKHPEYRAYMNQTAMFIPGNPGGKLFKLSFGRIPNQVAAHLAVVLFVFAMVISSATGLRNLTIASISKTRIPDKHILAISVFPHTEQYLRDVIYKVMADEPINNALSEQGSVSFISHIMPGNYGMLGHFAEVNRQEFRQQMFQSGLSIRERIWGTDSDQVKVSFARADKPGKVFVPLNEILDMSVRMTPVLVADLNLKSGEVSNVTLISKHHYGITPQPMF
jgi:hypothetical protein